ncbi:hypothetical protein ACS0TY_036982 [Phlomoides rotata]
MRCIAHIINLVVTDWLKEIGESVKKIRNSVRYMRPSPARLKKFKECVEHEKIKSNSLLCLDVATRWNSTYLMLESAQKFEKAFNRYDSQDLSYMIEMQMTDVLSDGTLKKIDGTPRKEDWEKTRKMTTFLRVFYELTLRISGSKYVTSNLFFREIYMIHFLLNDWTNSDDDELHAMSKKMKGKFDKYWGDPKKMNKVVFIACILDPRYKFEWMQFALSNMYGSDVGLTMGFEVKELLFSLFSEYKNEIMPDLPNDSSGIVGQSSEMDVDDPTIKAQKMIENEFKRFKSDVIGVKSSKSEVEKYLNEEIEGDDSKFDILAYWKGNGLRFPFLSQIARDILDVPISTVASESTFSTEGRVLDSFRSSLTSKVVQSLICGQDWLRKSTTPINVEETLAEIEDLDKGLQSVAFESSTDP